MSFVSGAFNLYYGQDSIVQVPAEPSVDPEVNDMLTNGIPINGISLNGLCANEEQLKKLIINNNGHAFLRHAVECALEEGDIFTVRGDGITHTFSDSLGLAPEWKKRPLSPSEQRWLSACLLAKVNFFGIHIPISLRGNHPALNPTASEIQQYSVEEGAFYGNQFSKEPFVVSCIGQKGLATDASPDLKNRVCVTNIKEGKTICGFVAAGQCWEICEFIDKELTQGYRDCRCGPDSDDIISEVITVFLRSDVGRVQGGL